MRGPVLQEIGDYVPIEWADMPVKNEWTCTSRNGRVCTDKMSHYAWEIEGAYATRMGE
jgi:hypothetical protein